MSIPRILIVDDDPSIRKFVQLNLQARGYQVLMAADGEEGVRMGAQEKPDLFLVDFMMPGLDGFAVCRKIREWSNTPIIMMSARAAEEDKDKCAACGANEYLVKPFILKDLLALIKTQLKQD